MLDAILDMYDHTIQVTSNPKIFLPEYEWLTSQIKAEARMIYHCCRVANEDLDNRIAEDAAERLRLEEQALQTCYDLKTDIRLAKKIFHLRARKAIAWTEYVNKAIKLIKVWHCSEEKCYKENHGL